MSYNKPFLRDVKTLSIMVDAGSPLLRALRALSQPHWDAMAKLIEDGATFTEAIKKQGVPDVAQSDLDLFAAVVNAGELGGVIEVVLKRYADTQRYQTENSQVTFSRYLGILVSCGVPILQSIKLTPTLTPEFVKLKIDLYESIKAGNTFYVPFKASGLFPEWASIMVDVGEQTGAFPEMMMRIAESIEELEKF